MKAFLVAPCISLSRAARWCGPLLVLIAALTPSFLSAQPATGEITGRVVNQASGDYLRNAQVSVSGTAITTLADTGGFYRLTGVPAGANRVAVSYTGLDPVEVPVTVIAGETVTQNITLTSASYDPEMVTLGTYVVNATREGNAKAIMDQRVAVNMKKVVATDAMGNVSEGNVGEFLKLMPGVAMEYVEADTRAMRVRGLNPKYANVLFDGMQPASAGSSNVGTGRAFEFEQLSISSIETVELTKAPTPDQPSSVAGTVNLRTKSAFDRGGRRLSFMAGISANSYYGKLAKTAGWDNQNRYKQLPNGELEFSDVFMDGKLGLIAGISQSSTIAAQKHIWNFGPTWNADPADNADEVPRINRWWFQDGPKPTQRGNYNVRLDYRVSDALQVYGRVDFTTYDARFYNRTMNLFANAYAPGATHTDMTVTDGRIQTDSNQFMTKEGDTLLLTGGATYQKGNFTADLGLHKSVAKNFYGNLDYGHFTDFASQLTGISWRMTRSSRGSSDIDFEQLSGPNWRDPANYRFVANSIGWHERNAKDQQWSARLDFKHDLSAQPLSQVIKYGALFNLKVLDVARYGFLSASLTGPDGVSGTADDQRPAAYLDDNFRPNWGFGGNMNEWFALSPWKLHDRFVSHPGDFVVNTAANNLNRLRNNWDFEETITSFYAVDTFTFGRLSVSPGLRHEKTKNEGEGINSVSNTKVTGENSFDSTLSYLHASYKFTPNLVARASYHTAITRADIANLIPGISGIDFTNAVLTATNPDLKPERSKSFNASLEYYFEPVGLVSVSAFHTEVKDRQFANRTMLGADGYEGDTTYASWTLASAVNIPYPTDYAGIEIDYQQQLSFLPGVLSRLGVFANHTRIKFDDWAFNTGSPEVITNGGLSFSYKKFFGRLNFNKVGKILTNASKTYNSTTNVWTDVAPFRRSYQRDRLVTDINLEYQLTDKLTLFFDGRNILNEESVYTYFGREENFDRILRTGGIFMLGIKGRY
jgi:iron complex outermembrane receptor protein